MIKSLWCIIFLSVAAIASSTLDFLNTTPFIGVSADYSERRGTYDLGNGVSQEVNRNDLITYGIVGGKRFALSPWLRLQVEGVIKYGSVIDDTFPAGTYLGEATVVRTSLLHGGLIADLQIPIEPLGEHSSISRFYFHAGAGLHLARIWETELLLDDQSQTVTGDPALEPPHVMLSPSVHAGIGWEAWLSRDLGLALSYALRYWDPVHYTATGDQFPLGTLYSERFFTHEIDVLFLIKR
jgi:hypothetical protein